MSLQQDSCMSGMKIHITSNLCLLSPLSENLNLLNSSVAFWLASKEINFAEKYVEDSHLQERDAFDLQV